MYVRRDKSWPTVGWAVSWLLCLIFIACGAFLVFAYCISFGNDVTYQWMVSVIISFFASVFFFQPIKVCSKTI